MPFDPTRPTSDRNRARPSTAADAFVQAEAKSRITVTQHATRIGLGLTLVGVLGLTRIFERRRLYSPAQVADIPIKFPGGQTAMLTFGQVASLCITPLGLIVAAVAFYLNRRFTREAMANPTTAGIFDPSVEWPEQAAQTKGFDSGEPD